MSPSTSTPIQLAVPAWVIPLLVMAIFTVLTLILRITLRKVLPPPRSVLPSNNFEMTDSSWSSQIVEPPPAYDPCSPPPYSRLKVHRPHTAQSSLVDSGALSSRHSS
ncbi:hypothetical protein PISMIDRAFT_269233 [Pisolithus microcarpus 441]|uniref:Uncharacterized protein n=1 Tax=Pisolithus microcarpus 441 TaxID=765257 RepID=A0A0C9XV28_9AGAM|nr:hypothetical protein BKA83DRAFT_269233 [Pisolithus microcarpus]KIK16280.1 hypothetical protein PISMIDRAFT_269233 [Pisolithus microcarpus 441]